MLMELSKHVFVEGNDVYLDDGENRVRISDGDVTLMDKMEPFKQSKNKFILSAARFDYTAWSKIRGLEAFADWNAYMVSHGIIFPGNLAAKMFMVLEVESYWTGFVMNKTHVPKYFPGKVPHVIRRSDDHEWENFWEDLKFLVESENLDLYCTGSWSARYNISMVDSEREFEKYGNNEGSVISFKLKGDGFSVDFGIAVTKKKWHAQAMRDVTAYCSEEGRAVRYEAQLQSYINHCREVTYGKGV